MAVQIWNGSSWVHAKDIPVWNGSSWVGAKSVKVWDGSSWKLSWPIRSTVSVTGPTIVMSENCANPTGQNYIAKSTFTVSLDTPSSVSKVEISFWSSGGGWAAPYKTVLNPTGNVTADASFAATGTRYCRAIITFLDGQTLESNHHAFTCYTKTLYATVNDHGQIGGNPAIFTASCGADCPGVQISSAWYWWNGSSMIYHTTGNPGYWYNPDRNVDFYYRENFPDGSYLYSTVAAVRPTSAEYILNGGHCHDINAAMIAARQQGKPLRLTGTFDVYTNVYIVDGLEIRAQGATFNVNTKDGAYNAGRFRNGRAWPNTGALTTADTKYSAGGFTWYGGTFNGNGDGIWTISHSPGFTVDGATFYNWASDTNDGHAIEINSSGGNNDLAGTGWRVNVLNCRFAGLPNGQRTNSNDEALQYDWAWQGSGVQGAEDHTMCHNIRVAYCTFDRLAAWSSLNNGYALCAVGGHRMGGGSYGDMGNVGIANPADGEPSQRHNWLLVEHNTIYNAKGATSGVSPNKGAVALWNVRDVIVRNNAFHNCTDTRLVSAWDANTNRVLTDSYMNISISGNTHNGVAKTITMPSDSHTTGG